MRGIGGDDVTVTGFDYLSSSHHGDLMAYVSDHAQVVRNEWMS